MQFLKVTKKQTTSDIETLFPKKRSTSNLSRSATLIPENRSRYKFIQSLGQGVNRHVVKAKDHQTGKTLAAKNIKFNLTNFYKFKQILREVSILRQLKKQPGSQKYVQQLFDVEAPALETGHTNKQVGIVTEFIEGMTLQDYLDKAQRKELKITVKVATTLIFNLLKAVEFIHKAGILHRDIKPANLIVTPDLGIIIIDFGLARTVVFDIKWQENKIPQTKEGKKHIAQALEAERPSRKKCRRTLSPHVCARSYRPPEVAITEPYSFSADIWSVGCIIAEILRASDKCQLGVDEPRQLFPACSNFPLTPDPFLASQEMGKDCLAEDDLTRIIIEVLGDPRKEDLSFISRSRRKQIIQNCFTGKQKYNYQEKLNGAPKNLVLVMHKCLQYNPYFRYSASLLLQTSAFSTQPLSLVLESSRPVSPLASNSSDSSSSSASYHSGSDSPGVASSEPSKIFLEVDAPDAFDYGSRFPKKHGIEDLRSMLNSELDLLHKQ